MAAYVLDQPTSLTIFEIYLKRVMPTTYVSMSVLPCGGHGHNGRLRWLATRRCYSDFLTQTAANSAAESAAEFCCRISQQILQQNSQQNSAALDGQNVRLGPACGRRPPPARLALRPDLGPINVNPLTKGRTGGRRAPVAGRPSLRRSCCIME